MEAHSRSLFSAMHDDIFSKRINRNSVNLKLLPDAAELGENVWIVRLIPVPEARPDEIRRGRPRSAFQDEVLPVEEISGVVGIVSHIGCKPRERRERSISPFPAVADELFDSPWACAARAGAHRHRR